MGNVEDLLIGQRLKQIYGRNFPVMPIQTFVLRHCLMYIVCRHKFRGFLMVPPAYLLPLTLIPLNAKLKRRLASGVLRRICSGMSLKPLFLRAQQRLKLFFVKVRLLLINSKTIWLASRTRKQSTMERQPIRSQGCNRPFRVTAI